LFEEIGRKKSEPDIILKFAVMFFKAIGH